MADETLLDRRVMAVKIDNHRRARPQSGLQEAEAVFELLVESGITRFMALFHTVDSEYVGPIRSLRPTDVTLLKALGAPMQTAGATAWVLRHAAETGVDIIAFGDATFRISTRSAPHNLYGSTPEMRHVADGRSWPDDPPQALFQFGSPTTPSGEATEISLSWSGGNNVRWVYDGQRYLRFTGDTEHLWVDQDGNSEQIAFDTLLVLSSRRYTASPPPGTNGSSLPALETVGSGTALAFYSGGVVEATWARSAIEDPFALTLADGNALVLPPGRIWVSVFPSDRSVSWD